jgi:hypothetical protein
LIDKLNKTSRVKARKKATKKATPNGLSKPSRFHCPIKNGKEYLIVMVSIPASNKTMQEPTQMGIAINETFPIVTDYNQQPLVPDFALLGQAVISSNLTRGFTQIPNVILHCPDISPRAKAVYGVLLSHARNTNTCFPGQRRMAKLTGYSEDTIQRGLKDLRGYLVRIDETGKLVVDQACADCQQAQNEEPDPRQKPFCRCPKHKCLVVWRQRGLTHTNMYGITPLYHSLDELQEALVMQGGEEIVSPDAESTSHTYSSSAVSENRMLRSQEIAQCGTKNTKPKHTQGNEVSISKPSLEKESGAIGNVSEELEITTEKTENTRQNSENRKNHQTLATPKSHYLNMHEIPEETEEPDLSKSKQIEIPQQKETAPETAKQVESASTGTMLEQQHSHIRALASVGISVNHWQELNRQGNYQHENRRPQTKTRELPDWLVQVMTDFSRDLNDSPRLQSNLTNLDRVYVYCRDYLALTDEEFYYLIAEMKRRARYAVIMDTTPEGKPARAKYFFTCIYNEIGYRPAKR